MTDARDELLRLIAKELWDKDALDIQGMADAALLVVETATSTCEECEGTGLTFTGAYEYDGGKLYSSPECPSCGGQPGPLLILQVLGGQVDPKANIYVGDNWEAAEVWRFPRRQEGTP